MSPEQLRGEDIDARSDLWAVGIILHELVTGAHPLDPFSAARLVEIVNLDLPMPAASERRPDVGALGALIDRCLKKHPAERIGTYCMPIERRMDLLRVSKAAARANQEACLRRVEEARVAAAGP